MTTNCNCRPVTAADLGIVIPARTNADTALFEEILDAEQVVRLTKVVDVFAPSMLPQGVKEDRAANVRRSQERLFELIGGMSPEQMQAFGEYRKTH